MSWSPVRRYIKKPANQKSRLSHSSLTLEVLEQRMVLTADPIITEFMASNNNTLLDGNGDSSDWIEIFNAGDTPIDLEGWHLTDNSTNLTRWTFPDDPNSELDPGEFLVVFASSNNTPDLAGNLHTNFSLNADNDYLALVRPDLTIVTEYETGGANFPQQFEDVSYGRGQTTEIPSVFVSPGDTAQTLIPTAAVPVDWNEATFTTDSNWIVGPTAVGFDETSSSVTSGPEVLSIDFNGRPEQHDPSHTEPGFQAFVIDANEPQEVAVTRSYGDIDITLTPIADPFDGRYRGDTIYGPFNDGAFTEELLLQDFLQSKEQQFSGGIDILIEGLTPNEYYTFTVWSYDGRSEGHRVSDWVANGMVAKNEYSFTHTNLAPPPSNETNQFSFTVAANSNGDVLISGRNDASSFDENMEDTIGVFLNALKIEEATQPLIAESVLRIDFNDRTSGESGAANTEAGFSTITLDQSGETIDGVKVTLAALGGATLDDRDRSTPGDVSPFFTQDQLYDDFIFADGSFDGAGIEVTLEGLIPNQQYDLALWTYDSSGGGSHISAWTEVSGGSAVVLESEHGFTGADGSIFPTQDNLYRVIATVTASDEGQLIIQGERITFLNINGGNGAYLNALELSVSKLSVATDISTELFETDSSAYVRVPFDVPSGMDIGELLLNMNYDDGFVAYLNGTEVARSNAPGAVNTEPAFTDNATTSRSISETLTKETFDISTFINELIIGGTGGDSNVLAIHGLNVTDVDTDFYISPELIGIEFIEPDNLYYEDPTPGAPNSTGVLGFVDDTSFTVDRGFFDVAFTTDITTATPGATIIYTTDGSVPTLSNGTQVAAPDANTPPLATVNITTTTTLRAAAFLGELVPSNTDTQTYIFIEHVVSQTNTPAGFPAAWGAWGTADYEMDQDVVNDIDYSLAVRAGLESLGSLSLVGETAGIFGPAGIYSDVHADLEIPTSAELIFPDNSAGFQIDAGLTLQGGGSRNNSPKHSLSLRFRNMYGQGKLNYPLFEGSDVTSFDSLQLRGMYNNSWIHGAEEQRPRGTLIRDQFIRDSLIAMGEDSAGQGTYVNLYINGLYWGVYNVHERQEASHYAEYFGGVEEDYDALKGADSPVDGDLDAYNAMKATVAGGDWNAIQQVVDIDNFIDFTIIQRFAGSQDLKVEANWRAAGGGINNAPWRFYSWDAERILEDIAETEVLKVEDPTGIRDNLLLIPEFVVRFGDRLHEHFFNDGALTSDNNIARWQARVDQLNDAIVAESARWGDYRRDVAGTANSDLYTRDDHWTPENDRLTGGAGYFDFRSDFVVSLYQTSLNLYPDVVAPSFSQHGGIFTAGASLTITAPTTQIYYTTDGSDPRLEGGAISGTLYAGAFVLNESSTISSRVWDGVNWSALNTAFFTVEVPLRVTEIMYHPTAPTQDEETAGFDDDDDFEFLELMNTGASPIDLQGVHFTDGIDFTFSSPTVVPAGGRVLLVRDLAAYTERYGAPLNPTLTFQYGDLQNSENDSKLNNDGEIIAINDAAGGLIQSFEYNDTVSSWHKETDGNGFSLVVLNTSGDYDDPANWRSSALTDGSPGFADASKLDADFNGDGTVNRADLRILLQNYGTTSDAHRATGDVDNNGSVNLTDLLQAKLTFGDVSSSPPPAAAAASLVVTIDISPATVLIAAPSKSESVDQVFANEHLPPAREEQVHVQSIHRTSPARTASQNNLTVDQVHQTPHTPARLRARSSLRARRGHTIGDSQERVNEGI